VYRWVEHTAEVELEIHAGTERAVLIDALAALGELLGIGDSCLGAEPVERELQVSATDRPALLASWLEELVYLAESEGFVTTAAKRLEIGEREVSATVTGVLDDPPPLVKAVTYHRLLFEPADGGYVARVVFDV
jgi:SHS2 domain-containing protein